MAEAKRGTLKLDLSEWSLIVLASAAAGSTIVSA
jgi:hypothetical protein